MKRLSKDQRAEMLNVISLRTDIVFEHPETWYQIRKKLHLGILGNANRFRPALITDVVNTMEETFTGCFQNK